MSDLLFLDSAFPPASYPAGVDGIAFYVGGDTPHVWATAEIAACPYRFRLPIYVRSNPPGPGAAADVAACLARLAEIGAPHGTLVAWDMETAADAAYITDVYTALKNGGYKLIVYGSQSAVLGNQNPDGLYWGADWTGVRNLLPPDAMTQYVNLGPYDESDARPALPFWDAKPVLPTPLPDPPALPPVSMVTVSVTLPILRQGVSDSQLAHWYVHRVQVIVNGVYGKTCPVSGNFDTATATAVRAVQAGSGLAADGVVGPLTWRLLLAAAK